jgi:hypothetical protein
MIAHYKGLFYSLPMRIRVVIASLFLSLISPIFITQAQVANAACGFINGVWSHELAMTPQCVAENNATADAVKAAAEAKAIQDQKDVEARAKAQAELDYIANGSRPCTLYPASITPACVAENLIDAAKKTAAMEEKMIQDQKDVEARAKAQAELDYIANGSRPCTLYPASITPACAAENLEYETKRQLANAAKFEADQLEAEAKALRQAKDDYIRNGSRPCTLYPASTTAECAAENLKFEEIKRIEITALTAARQESSKSLITTKDENGSLLVVSNIPKGVNLLNTKVRLVNSKGKLVDAGEIRYDSSGRAYFVFDKQVGKGNYRIELSIPKKKAATIAVRL